MIRNLRLIATACAACAALATTAQAAKPADEDPGDPTLRLIEHPVRTFDRSLEIGALQVRYASLLERAAKHDAKPREHVLDQRVATAAELRRGIEQLRERIEKARRAERREARMEALAAAGGEPAPAEAGGEVPASSAPSGTLESIAACESGGDPGAVNPAGYYGKYQFDMGTWQSVGGSGNPAQASEAEQDYRAGLLYQQSGSSPWPVCGG